MKCEDLLAALNGYVDGDLDPSICQFFEAHLADCNPCHIVVDNIRCTITLYKGAKAVELPPEFQERLGGLLKARWKTKYHVKGI